MPETPIYYERRNVFYKLLTILAEDPDAIEQILAPFTAAEESSLWKRVKRGLKTSVKVGRYLVKTESLGFILDYRNDYHNFYFPEGIQLRKIIAGNAVYDPLHSNFYIALFKDPETLVFFKENSKTLSKLIDNLAPHLLSIILNNIKSQPDTDGLKILLNHLQESGFNDDYIRQEMLPWLVKNIKKTLEDPKKNLGRLNWLLEILSTPKTPLSKNSIAFVKRAEVQFRRLFAEQSVLKLAVAFLSDKPKNYKEILSDLAMILDCPEWKTIFEGIPKFLNDNKKDLQEVIFSRWEKIHKRLDLPPEISRDFAKDFLDLTIDWSSDVSPLIFKLFKEGLAPENHAVLLAIFSLYKNQPTQPKVLPQIPEMTSASDNASALYLFIVPQFLIALKQNGVDMKVIFKALSDNTDILLKITRLGLDVGLREESAESRIKLIKALFKLAFNSEKPFIKALGEASSEQLAKAIIETPILRAELAKWGIEAPLIIGTVPILRRTAGVVLKHPSEIQGIIQYYSGDSTPQTDLKFVQDLASIAQDVFLEADYLVNNKDRILTLVGIHFNLLKEKLNIPEDFSKEFVKDTLSLGIDLSQDLLPFVGDLTRVILRENNHALIVTIINQVRQLLKVQGTSKEGQAIDALLNSIFKLDDHQMVRRQLPDMLRKHSEPLGKLIDQFLTQTTMGKKVYIDTSEFLRVASHHMPQLKLISELYLKRDKKWVWKAASLLLDKQVFAFVLKTLCRLLAHKLNPQKPSLKMLTKKLDLFFKENAGTKMMDIGYWLEKEAQRSGSIMSRDFKGINFSKAAQKLALTGCILKGFTFDKAKLENVSFENSVIKNCSFEGVKFIGKPNFKGVKMDMNSFISLQAAIKDYNSNPKNQSNPIQETEMPTVLRPS